VADEKSGDYQSYLNRRYDGVRRLIPKVETPAASRPEVRLIEFDPESETKILAGILFQQMHVGWEQAFEKARSLDTAGRRELFQAYSPQRKGRWYKVGRAFENAYLRFEIVMDIGSYRDLHRHRMMTQERQTFTTAHGYSVPAELTQAGLASSYSSALDQADKLFRKLEPLDRDLAQYVVPLANRMRFYQWQNFRQLFWEVELRTISQGHPDYRWIEQEKYRLIRERFPLIAEMMLVDLNDYSIARRGTEERIEEKEKRLREQLKQRKS